MVTSGAGNQCGPGVGGNLLFTFVNALQYIMHFIPYVYMNYSKSFFLMYICLNDRLHLFNFLALHVFLSNTGDLVSFCKTIKILNNLKIIFKHQWRRMLLLQIICPIPISLMTFANLRNLKVTMSVSDGILIKFTKIWNPHTNVPH